MQIGEPAIAVTLEHLDQLIGHIHLYEVGHGRGFGRRPGCIVRQHGIGGKQGQPGFLPDNTVTDQAVLLLKGLDGGLRLFVKAAGRLAVQVSQIAKLLLQGGHSLLLAAILQLAGKAGIGRRGGGRRRRWGSVGIGGGHDDIVPKQFDLRCDVCRAACLQAVERLKVPHGLHSRVQIDTGNIAQVKPKNRKPSLQFADIGAFVVLFEGAVEFIAVDDLQQIIIHLSGLRHAVGLLHSPDSFLRLAQKVAGRLRVQVFQGAQALLQLPDIIAPVTAFEHARFGRHSHSFLLCRVNRRNNGRLQAKA